MHPNRTMIARVCEHCAAAFEVEPNVVRKGHGRFCSRACHDAQRLVIPLADRFWRHVKKTNTCWLWTGNKDRNGYGRILDKPHSQGGKPRLAHRVAWELTNGPIPDGLNLCHHCDVPTCVRPDHMFVGTQADNMADCSAKRRVANGSTKLTEEQVRLFRREYRAGARLAAMGRKYGIHWQTIADIVHGRTWKHVSDDPYDHDIVGEL